MNTALAAPTQTIEVSCMLQVYNPSYGALFEFDETQPADPAKIGRWTLNYTSRDRGLTPDEIEELKANGKIGSYPDEFFLVGFGEWPLERVLLHRQAVQAFRRVNESGPAFPHRDRLGNKRVKVTLNFIPGPVVDIILESSRDTATEKVSRMILAAVPSRFRTLRSFQKKAMEHARNLVEAVTSNSTVLQIKPATM